MPQAADILSDADINQAYEDVRSDKSETTWLVLKVRLDQSTRSIMQLGDSTGTEIYSNLILK
jgi:hypothetical protein